MQWISSRKTPIICREINFWNGFFEKSILIITNYNSRTYSILSVSRILSLSATWSNWLEINFVPFQNTSLPIFLESYTNCLSMIRKSNRTSAPKITSPETIASFQMYQLLHTSSLPSTTKPLSRLAIIPNFTRKTLHSKWSYVTLINIIEELIFTPPKLRYISSCCSSDHAPQLVVASFPTFASCPIPRCSMHTRWKMLSSWVFHQCEYVTRSLYDRTREDHQISIFSMRRYFLSSNSQRSFYEQTNIFERDHKLMIATE